jgi:predicted O-linked N-acetylglucosamine transferase (SPINDLY family)
MMFDPTAPPNLALVAVEAGVDPSRVVWSTFFRKETEFLIKGMADLFVDTPNFNAHTTGRSP